MNIDVVMNPAYIPFLDKPQYTQIFFGGSSSGKSYFLAQKIVLDNLSGVNWLCCRNVAKTLRRSVYNEVVKAISSMGLRGYYRINQTDMVITCTLNNKQILFAGLDDTEKVKSITPVDGVFERIFVEEATEIRYSAYKQLTKRLRGRSEHTKCVILAFNPILKSHWIYKTFYGEWADNAKSYEDETLCILKTTYRDNRFLTAQDRDQLENETDPYYRDVYTDGNWGVLGHVIFRRWHVEDLSALIPSFDRLRCGMDFGYSDDPNALIKTHFDKKRRRIYVFQEHYQAGMSDSELLRVCRSFFGRQYVACDNADPKTIAYLSGAGVNAYAVRKGADSINRGIRWFQDYEIIVDVRCQNFKNEIEQYHWKEDKYGNAMAVPVDMNNHLLDALRYAYEDEIDTVEVTAGRRV